MTTRQVHPIEQRSYEILRSLVDTSVRPPHTRAVIERVVHASADLDYAAEIVADEAALVRAAERLREGAPIVTDVAMVAAGITARRTVCRVGDPAAAELARELGITRSAAGMRLAAEEVGPGAIYVIGCAPTALFELIALAAGDRDGARGGADALGGSAPATATSGHASGDAEPAGAALDAATAASPLAARGVDPARTALDVAAAAAARAARGVEPVGAALDVAAVAATHASGGVESARAALDVAAVAAARASGGVESARTALDVVTKAAVLASGDAESAGAALDAATAAAALAASGGDPVRPALDVAAVAAAHAARGGDPARTALDAAAAAAHVAGATGRAAFDVAPTLVIGLPVGFVGAAESKAALRESGLPAVFNISAKGGSAVAAAALNALLYIRPDA